ncbi:MAG: hypothetical protein ACPGYY_07185, partial [Bacteroidia bacterium]
MQQMWYISSLFKNGYMRKYVILSIILCLSVISSAQLYKISSDMVIKDENGVELNLALAGGLNQPQFSNLDFNNLKVAFGGGMAVQDIVANKWKSVTGCPLVEGYGLTET